MPTTLLVGESGTGKSFVATKIARHDLRRGRMVFSNFGIAGAQRFEIADLPHLPPGRVIIDEASSWFHARRWKDMADDLLSRWNQTRKDGWELLILVQHEDNLDATIKRNLTYAALLQPCWKPLTRWDPRIKALARVETEKARAQFAEYVAEGLFPPDTSPPTIHPGEVTRPLYIQATKWHARNFRSMQKGRRPIMRRRYWWDWDVAMAYDTKEKLTTASSKQIFRELREGAS